MSGFLDEAQLTRSSFDLLNFSCSLALHRSSVWNRTTDTDHPFAINVCQQKALVQNPSTVRSTLDIKRVLYLVPACFKAICTKRVTYGTKSWQVLASIPQESFSSRKMHRAVNIIARKSYVEKPCSMFAQAKSSDNGQLGGQVEAISESTTQSRR